ncbi:Leucine-rich repeat-containing protein 51 [Mytilus coruscus]|uniref:Leucine-rich repeat-containing protein 51 n=1 Tax=Mytilus coruscus TaxID=42192 RepID=A0A6J8A4L3_MYTCO|nr:Leucine-rich repeat-containing protein 51 [Mytilus coruscus]
MSTSTSLVPYSARQKTTRVPTIDANNDIVPPLDFSFYRVSNVGDVKEEEPRESPRKGKQPEPEGGKSSSKCLRLNNNSLTEVGPLMELVVTKFENPSLLAWLDLSFNELTNIHPVITEFENLQILYLHGNMIKDLKEIEKLSVMKSLRKLTFHGNPVENSKGYRQNVLTMLPRLENLDFSRVTKADRMTANTWAHMNANAKHKKKKMAEDD